MNNKTPEEISMMLRKMHMSSMAEEYMEQMADTNAELMPFEERFNKIVEAEWDARYNKKFQKFLKKQHSGIRKHLWMIQSMMQKENWIQIQ